MTRVLLAVLFLAHSFCGLAQTENDSLINAWQNLDLTAKDRFDARKTWIWNMYLFSNPDSALILAKELERFCLAECPGRMPDVYNLSGVAHFIKSEFELSEYCFRTAFGEAKRIGDRSGMTSALVNLGNVLSDKGKYDEAVGMYARASLLAWVSHRFGPIASGLNNMAIIRQMQGNTHQAINLYQASLKIRDRIGDVEGMGSEWNNLGTVYMETSDYTQARASFLKSLVCAVNANDEYKMANTLSNLGNVARKLNEPVRAREYLNQSMALCIKLGDRAGIGTALNMLGELDFELGNTETAVLAFSESLEVFREADFPEGIIQALTGLAKVHRKTKPETALKMAVEALELSRKEQALTLEREAMQEVYLARQAIGDFQGALQSRERYLHLRDSIMGEENHRALIRTEYQYEYDSKESVLMAERTAGAEVLRQQLETRNFQRNLFIGGSAMMLLVAGVSFRGLRRKRKVYNIISAQKAEMEDKNRQLLLGINAARRLQEAVLPPQRIVKDYFDQSFLLYMPKDIVSGDFYWMEEKNGINYVAVGDCTGHGVPGALLSVLGLNALNRCLAESGNTTPDAMLNRLNELVKASFDLSEHYVRDGMDIALLMIDSTGSTVSFSGANNPLWRAREGNIEVFKPDRKPIGRSENDTLFSSIVIETLPGDAFYLVTDGAADQIGGPLAKKLKTKTLRSKLEGWCHLPMMEQREKLAEFLIEFRGLEEQTDDICILALKV